MIIYIFILLLIYIVSLVNLRKFTKVDVFFFVLLALISGFRFEVGTDFFNYVNNFDALNLGQEVSLEPGFIIISKLVLFLNLNSQGLFLIFSILTLFFLYKGLKFYSDDSYIYKPVLYIILMIFVFFPSLNVMRQLLAASILLYASSYIVKKNFLRFLLLVITATLFHYSSLIFLPLYFVALKSFNRITMLVLLLLSVFISRYEMISTLLKLVNTHLSFLDYKGYISYYITNSAYNSQEKAVGITFIINACVLVLFILLKDRLIKNNKTLIAFNLFYCFILVYILSFDVYVLSRINYYFSVYMAITISSFGILFDRKSSRVVEYTLLVLYTIMYLYIILFQPAHDIIPYDFNIKLFN